MFYIVSVIGVTAQHFKQDLTALWISSMRVTHDFCFIVFETEMHSTSYTAEDTLELLFLLSPPPGFWDYKHVCYLIFTISYLAWFYVILGSNPVPPPW